VDADLDARMFFAEDGKGREQSVNGAFIYAEGELAAFEPFEFAETFFDFVAKIEQALGVFLEEDAGIGEADGAGAADEKWLAEGVFQLANAEADGGLGTKKTLAGAGETALLGNHEKNLQFAQIHTVSPGHSIRQVYQK
jgi:hypothetical protein